MAPSLQMTTKAPGHLWCSSTKYSVVIKVQDIVISSFILAFNSFTGIQVPHLPPQPHVFMEQLSYYRVLIMPCMKTVGKMKRSLKTHLRLYYYWRQRGPGGRPDINVRLLKPLGVHSCLIAERIIVLDCVSLGIKRTTGANLMRGYFTSRFFQSRSNNVLQSCCEPGILQACTFAAGFKTIYFK